MNVTKSLAVIPQQNINENEAAALTQPKSLIQSVDPAQGTLQGIHHENIGFFGAKSDDFSFSDRNITNASAVAQSSAVDLGPEVKITGKDILEALEYVTSQLTPFFQTCDESNALKIFVFSKDKKSIELRDNTISSDSGDMVVEASHEEAKEFFVNHLTVLYGKEVIDCFFSQEQRKEPLTLAQAHVLRGQLNEFQKSLEVACQGDPSNYDACLKSHLETLHQLQKSVVTAFASDGALRPQVESLTDYLSKQLGASPETVQASLVAGMALSSVGAVAATGGLALPSALHVAVTSAMGALAHGLGLGVQPLQ